MTREQIIVIQELRDEGHAVIIWTPEELGTASANRVQDRSIQLGQEVIDDLQD